MPKIGVPIASPADCERLVLITRFQKELRRFQLMKGWQREAEHADLGEQTCRSMLAQLADDAPVRS